MSLDDDIRRLVIQTEQTLPDGGRRDAFKEALAPQYRLLLTTLSRPQPPSIARVDDYLRVVRAMHEPGGLADLTVSPDSEDLDRLLTSPLRVLGSFLSRLPRTTMLVIETGVDVLTLCAVRGGPEPLSERIALDPGSKEFAAALTALTTRHRDDIARLLDQPLDEGPRNGLKAAGEAMWKALPSGVRAVLQRADTIFYLVSPFGQLSEVPIELCWTEYGWLGTTRVVARFPSLRTLVETLSPNRMPSRLEPSALIVRATRDEKLTYTDEEISGVLAALQRIGLRCRSLREPRLIEVTNAFETGLRVLHVVGHGMANPFGEALPIGSRETLRPEDFSQLGGARTPFAFLNACEIGRARTGAVGGAAGFSTRLVEKGGPAVVACLQAVPDRVAARIAVAFYDAAARCEVGEALSKARAIMDAEGYPVAFWGAYVLFGDPALSLQGKHASVRQIRDATRSWPAHLSRFLITRSARERSAALDVLTVETRQAPPDEAADLGKAACWVKSAFGANGQRKDAESERLRLCHRLAKVDVVAAASLRMLLATERLERLKARDKVRGLSEAAIGLSVAAGVFDTIMWPYFAAWVAGAESSGLGPFDRRHLLDEAEGMLAGWALSEPGVEPLLSRIRRGR
jgi:CHAT domain